MSRARSAGAPEGIVGGTCRTMRRGAPPGMEWVRLYKRAQRKLDNATSLIIASVRTIADAGGCADRPVASTRKLIRSLSQAHVAAEKYAEAKRYVAEATEVFEHTPPELRSDEAQELLQMAAERCQTVHHYIYVAAHEALLGHEEISASVASGEVVPEDPSEEKPRRRVIRHNPLFVRAFLTLRQPRVTERITPLLQRRRRTRLPAEVRVPKRSLRGRAPPLSSTCSL